MNDLHEIAQAVREAAFLCRIKLENMEIVAGRLTARHGTMPDTLDLPAMRLRQVRLDRACEIITRLANTPTEP